MAYDPPRGFQRASINDQSVWDRYDGHRAFAEPGMRVPRRPRSGPALELPDWDRPSPDDGEGRFAGQGPSNYVRTPERLMERVCERMCDDPWLDASRMTVGCEGDVVVLEGTVASRAQKRRAEALADSVGGVFDVRNRLEVDRGVLGQQ